MYYVFAGVLIGLSVIAVVVSLYDTISNLNRIKKQAQYTCQVKVLRGEGASRAFTEVNSAELVPGDIIQIPDQLVIPCDLILIKGSCVMNESMLTGESIPAIKTSVPSTTEVYERNKDAKYTIFGGTKVVQARKAGD